jgi:hypothetical protein
MEPRAGVGSDGASLAGLRRASGRRAAAPPAAWPRHPSPLLAPTGRGVGQQEGSRPDGWDSLMGSRLNDSDRGWVQVPAEGPMTLHWPSWENGGPMANGLRSQGGCSENDDVGGRGAGGCWSAGGAGVVVGEGGDGRGRGCAGGAAWRGRVRGEAASGRMVRGRGVGGRWRGRRGRAAAAQVARAGSGRRGRRGGVGGAGGAASRQARL